MAHIALCDDEPDLTAPIAWHLRRAGHQVTISETARECLRQVEATRPALLLLDWNLPDLPGPEVLRRLSHALQAEALAVVMLTARDEEVDRIVGFELGATDYVTKPVALQELVLRISAILRRRGPVESGTWEHLGLRVDTVRGEVTLNGAPLNLRWQEQQVLLALARGRGRPLSRAQLLNAVREDAAELGERVVDQWIMRLRERLGPVGARIEAVRSTGYRLA